MTDPLTTNKGFDLPANGEYPNTWDVVVNANWNDIDTAFGGVTTLNVVAASGTVTLSRTQYLPPTIILAGALTSNVNYQLPSGVGGLWSVYNGATGNFTVTISSAGGGVTVVVLQGLSTLIWSDGTNVRVASPAVVATGSWTPTFSFQTPGTSVITYGSQTGGYRYSGGIVTIDFDLSATITTGSAAGGLWIGGLPYPMASTAAAGTVGSLSSSSWIGYLSTSLSLDYADPTHLLIGLTFPPNGTSQFSPTNVTSGAAHRITGSITYRV